jgi:GT2 family glycosyltransferase
MTTTTRNAPRVAIVLVNWNNWRDCVECLDSLLAQAHQDSHVYIVDNDSADQSVEHIASWCRDPQRNSAWRAHDGVDRITDAGSGRALEYRIVEATRLPLPTSASCRVTLVRSGGNLGFAGGCNVGIRAAGLDNVEFFWFLNTDTVVHRDALAALLRRAARDATTGIVGSTLRYYGNPDVVQAMGGGRLEPRTAAAYHIGENSKVDAPALEPAAVERQMAYVVGASMLVSVNLVRDIGPMQEDYFLYYEEIDWAMRARGKFTLGYAADSHIFHKAGASSSKVMPLFSLGYYYRNRLRFLSRFLPDHLPAATRLLRRELVLYVLKGRFAKARIVADVLRNAQQLIEQARVPSAGTGS